jgi:hypothetical protein
VRTGQKFAGLQLSIDGRPALRIDSRLHFFNAAKLYRVERFVV